MPTQREAQEIADWRGFKVENVFRNNEAGDGSFLTDAEIKARYPLHRTTYGKVSSAPNMFWALEREIDARCIELYTRKSELTPEEKGALSGEMRGLAVAYSMVTGKTIEECSIAAMNRYMEMIQSGSTQA